jgi:Domain of unknown function (DUF4598)
MTQGSTGRTGKRDWLTESLYDGHVPKRRRRSDTSDAQGLFTAESGEEEASCGGSGVRASSVEASTRDCSCRHVDGRSERSSSGSNAHHTRETPPLSTKNEEVTRSAQSGETSSAGRDESSKGEELIQNLPLPRKPPISTPSHASSLHARLSSFLPELQKANAELELPAETLSRRLDDVGDDEEHYIEMSLGLGVFKEKRSSEAQADGITLADDDTTSSSEELDSDSAEARDEMGPQAVESTPLMDLMGSKQPPKRRPGIREVPDG